MSNNPLCHGVLLCHSDVKIQMVHDKILTTKTFDKNVMNLIKCLLSYYKYTEMCVVKLCFGPLDFILQ